MPLILAQPMNRRNIEGKGHYDYFRSSWPRPGACFIEHDNDDAIGECRNDFSRNDSPIWNNIKNMKTTRRKKTQAVLLHLLIISLLLVLVVSTSGSEVFGGKSHQIVPPASSQQQMNDPSLHGQDNSADYGLTDEDNIYKKVLKFLDRGQRDLNNDIGQNAQRNRPSQLQGSSFVLAADRGAAAETTTKAASNYLPASKSSLSSGISLVKSKLDSPSSPLSSSKIGGSSRANNSEELVIYLESTLEDLRARLHLLEQFVKISTQKLYNIEGRVSDLERCDCRIGCHWNNTKYADGYTWQKDCDICTCNRGSISCKHVVCEPSPCEEAHHVQGRCCPVCYKSCKFNNITLKHNHKTITSINNETCKECVCLDGRIECHRFELIISSSPLISMNPDHLVQGEASRQMINNQSAHIDQQRHHHHNNKQHHQLEYQKHLFCPPINCPLEDRFHLVNDCCTYCKDFDFCFHRGNHCHEHAQCTNSNNSFNCVCNEGFIGDGHYCHDIDECQDDVMNTCNRTTSICVNTLGSYKCQCLPGYASIGSSLTYDDNFGNHVTVLREQQKNTSHHNHHHYRHQKDLQARPASLDRVHPNNHCRDIDECSSRELNDCDINAKCVNKIGTFKCKCNRGYIGNGLECHKWVTSASNVASYRYNHRRRKKLLSKNTEQKTATEIYVNGVATYDGKQELDNSILTTTQIAPILMPIDEDDDYDDAEDEEYDEDMDESGNASNYTNGDNGVHLETELHQQAQISCQKMQKQGNKRQGPSGNGCLSEKTPKTIGTDNINIGDTGDNNSNNEGVRNITTSQMGSYLPLQSDDGGRHQATSMTMERNGSPESKYRSLLLNPALMLSSSSSMSTRTMFELPGRFTTTTASTVELPKTVTSSSSKPIGDQSTTTTVTTSSGQRVALTSASSAIKTNDLNSRILPQNQPPGLLVPKTFSGISNNPSSLISSGNNSFNMKEASSSKAKKGVITISAGSAPFRYRSQGHYHSASSSASFWSTLSQLEQKISAITTKYITINSVNIHLSYTLIAIITMVVHLFITSTLFLVHSRSNVFNRQI